MLDVRCWRFGKLSPKHAIAVIACLFLCFAARAQERERVALLIDNPVTGLGTSWPLYCGVPFPRGALQDPLRVRLVGDDGQNVRAQVRAMSRWAGDGSVRWLGVDFLGDPSGRHALEFGADVERPASLPGPSVVIQQDGETVRVSTGPAQFDIPSVGALIARAWLDRNTDGVFADDEVVITNVPGDDLYIVDSSNRTAWIGRDREGGQLQSEPRELESEGEPLHACLRREGWYVTATGDRVARHITRLHFYAGQSSVRIEHTFIFTEDSEKLWFRDVGIRFRHRLANATRVSFDNSSAFDAQHTPVVLGESDTSVFLFQEKAMAFSRRSAERDERFVIGRVGPDGTVREEETGGLCGEWARVSGGEGSVGVAVRDFWQQFPKEIEASRDSVTVHLWSDRGGQELDVRLETLRKKWPTEWLSSDADAYKAMVKRRPNAIGAAKTHELLLCLERPDTGPEETVRLAHVLNRPIYCLADPAWLYRSEAMGPIYPRDVERFPNAEGFMETWFDQYMKTIRSWGDHGFFDYGSGPHVWYRIAEDGPLAGTWIAYTDRYSGHIDYGFHGHLWRMYARSGQRKYLEYAEEVNRHRMDICMVHWDSPKAYDPIVGSYMLGRYKGAFTSGNSPDYWSPYCTLHHQSGTDLRKLYWYYYLRDYRRAHDVSKEYHELVLKVWEHTKGPFIGTRPFSTLKCLATLYQETGDPKILEIGRERLQALVDLDSPQGVTPKLATKLGKYGPKIAAVERWYEATGDELAADALVRGATTYARTSMGNDPYSYYNCMARVLNRAYRLTNDALFARVLERNMRLAVARYRDPQSGAWTDLFAGGVSASYNAYPMGDMAIGMDAVTRCGAAATGAPVVQQTGRGRPVVALFLKAEGEDVMFDVRGRYPLRPRVYTLTGEEVKSVRVEPYRESIGSLDKAEHPRCGLVWMPGEQPAGTYALDAGIGSAPWEVMSTSARQVVLYAPGGFTAGCGGTWKGRFYPGTAPEAAPLTWHFRVPDEADRFRIYRSGEIEMRDPDGVPVQPGTNAPGWADVPVSPHQIGRLWSFRAGRAAFVELRGVPPVFAAEDPERFFMPDLRNVDLACLGMERDYAFTDASVLPRGEAFVPVGDEGGTGLLLADGRALVLERGLSLHEGRYENFNSREGTFEVWLKPDWSSVYQPRARDAERKLLVSSTWSIALGNLGHLTSTFSVHGKDGWVRDVVGLSLERGRWTHLAYQWSGDGEDLVLQTYVNGRLRNVDHERAPRKAYFVGRGPQWPPRDIGEKITLGRASAVHDFLDAVIDELRISDVRRYDADFTPDRAAPLSADAHTLALFLFEGNTEGVGAGGRTIEAKLVK